MIPQRRMSLRHNARHPTAFTGMQQANPFSAAASRLCSHNSIVARSVCDPPLTVRSDRHFKLKHPSRRSLRGANSDAI